MPRAADDDGRTVTPDILARLDQEDAAIKDLVVGIVAHWAICPADPRHVCLGPIVHTLHDMAHASPCKTSAMLQAALGALAKVEWDRTHGA